MSNGMYGRRRRAVMHRVGMSDWLVESLEDRTLLSHAVGPAEVAAVQARHATTVMLQSSTKTTVAGQQVSLLATVRTTPANRLMTTGRVRFSTVSANPIVLGVSGLSRLGQAHLTTFELSQGGSYEVQAKFIPSQQGFASSSAQITLSTTPPEVRSFRIMAPQFFGAPGTPLTFTITAVGLHHQPVTDYTGTIDLLSTTDHAAKFLSRTYTFTTADQGTHTFPDGVTFHKGGAQILKVDQVTNTRIHGKATFGIE
jgi:hypothetical protein